LVHEAQRLRDLEDRQQNILREFKDTTNLVAVEKIIREHTQKLELEIRNKDLDRIREQEEQEKQQKDEERRKQDQQRQQKENDKQRLQDEQKIKQEQLRSPESSSSPKTARPRKIQYQVIPPSNLVQPSDMTEQEEKQGPVTNSAFDSVLEFLAGDNDETPVLCIHCNTANCTLPKGEPLFFPFICYKCSTLNSPLSVAHPHPKNPKAVPLPSESSSSSTSTSTTS